MDSQINNRGQWHGSKQPASSINKQQKNSNGVWENVDFIYQDQKPALYIEKEQQFETQQQNQPQQQFQQQNYQNIQQKQNFQNPPKFQQYQTNYQQAQSYPQGGGYKNYQTQNSQNQQIRTNTNRQDRNQNQQNIYRNAQKNRNESSSSGEREEDLIKQSQPNLNPEQRPQDIEQEGLNYLRKQKRKKQLKEQEQSEIKEQRRLEAAVHKKYLNKKFIEDCLRKSNPCEALIQHFKQFYPRSGQITIAIDNIKIEKFRNFIEFMHQMVDALLVSANNIPYIDEIFNSQLYQTQLLAEYNYLIENIHYKNAYQTNEIIKTLVPFIKLSIKFLTYSSNSLCCPLCTDDVQKIFQQIEKAKHPRLLIIEEEYEKFKQIFQNKLKIQEEKIQQRHYDETLINYDVCPSQPVSQELMQQKNIPYFGTIMKVLQSEPYASVESYLNNNFYILREDYMRDFRTAIFRLRESGFQNLDRDVLQYVFIYSDLNLEDVKASNNGVIYTVSFIPYDMRRRRIDWAKNNRLMTGSLLAITREDFSMFVFASVHYKNPQKIQDYYDKTGIVKIQIKLFGDKLIDCIQELNKLMMSQQDIFVIENKIYFETYIHYLRCIQQIDPIEFPLKDQLVYSKKGSPIPKYFGNAKSVMYGINLKYDLKQPTAYVFKNQIDILQPWNPSIKESLDDSQFKAIQLMVRSGLAIVQGPPGTGKTYCGALAIRILLNNQKQWNPDQQNELFFPGRVRRYDRDLGQVRSKNKPILVVCNTNHALDQFLSHILIFTKPEDVVRIGGRCKIDKIKQLGLKQVERARFDDEDRYKYKMFKQVQKQVQNDVSNMLNSADNVAFVDFIKFQGDLVEMIVNDFCLREDLSYQCDLNVETKRVIFYLWMDNKKPRDEHVDKIKKLEQKNGNIFIREVDLNKKKQWRGQMVYREPLNLQIGLSQEQIIRMLQEEYDGYDENENVNSDDENDRKIYDNHDLDPESKETQINQARQCLKRLGLDQQKLIKIQDKLNIGVSPWDLNSNERFVLITSVFVKKYDTVYEQAIEGIEQYDELNKELQEKFIEEDLKLIQSKKIVGATVTGCAKYAQKFDQLNFSIMIIEEAAEVLESHTVAILKKSVEHLILIGDHLQLKPKLQSYYLEIKYQPNISLFERLVNNQVEYVTLTNQRRMKSIFADFIRLIYDNYQDHPDILTYQNNQQIQGLESDLMFFDHRVLETNDSSTNSKSNMFEATMIIKMVGYLIKNGTNPKEITILATYMKQALIIKRQVENEKLYGVRVQTIDNYQGEENEYIFLSLVRSNKTKSLGFVSVDNRVCVALSRARIGMFIFGNFKFIYDTVLEKVKEGKGTDLWIRIIKLAQQKKVINDYIGLQCQSHKKKVEIRTVDDWRQVSGGGCNVDCNIKFDCGHVCKEKCHKFDHIRANCKNECEKILECGHKCKALCKKIDCPPCNWKVLKQLKCGHQQEVPCSQKNAICQQKCLKIMVCGHKCQMLCQDPCDQKRCYEYKNFTIPKCGHMIQIKCNQTTADGIICTKKCEIIQPCGHQCSGTCGGCLEGTFHQPCDTKCSRILRCGHECDRKCGQPCNRCNKPCSYKCCVEKCQLKCGEVCKSCQNKCKFHCDHQRCKMKCYEDCDREPCDLECNLLLQCGCQCSGLCGEKCPIICKAHNQEGYELLFGNELDEDAKFYALECPSEHVFEVQMLDQYFKQKSEELESEGGLLSYIRCPKCNLVISQSSRYQKYVKQVQKNLNEIKKIENQYMLINIDDIDDLKDKIKQLLKDNNNKDPESFLQHTSKFLEIQINKLNKGLSSEIIRHEYNCIKNQLDFYEYGIFIQNGFQVDNLEFNMHKKVILKEYLFNSDLFYRANDQFWERLAIKLETMKIYFQLKIEYQNNNEDRLLPLIIAIEDDNFVLSKQQLEKFKVQLQIKDIRKITKAVLDAGKGQGHWFKCPNGHFFAIGDCGGAMEVSKCVDCGAKIGGKQHDLLQDNSLASEIDGAQESAYKRLQRQHGNI